MESVWKIFDGYSRYRIYNDGRVFDNKYDRFPPTQRTPDGYPVITLASDIGKRRTFRIHRLVALLFVDPVKGNTEVNHKDGVKSNNHFTNLEWSNRSHNIQHAWDTGLLINTSARSRKLKEAHTGKKTGKDNPKSMPCKLVNTGEIFESQRIAGRQYGVDPGRISACCNNYPGYRSAGVHPVTKEKLIWEHYRKEIL